MEPITTEELIAQAPQGVHLSRNRLGIWRREGLIQQPHRKGRGKGVGGPVNLYPPETLERVRAVAELLGGRRDIDFRELRLGLWLRGEAVPWERVRSDILALTKMAEHGEQAFKAKSRKRPQAAEDELDEAASRMARVSGFSKLPFFDRVALRSAPQRLTFFLTLLQLTADGRLPLAREEEEEDNLDTPAEVIGSALAPPTSQLSPEERASALREADRYGLFEPSPAFEIFEKATAAEAEQARRDLIDDLGGAAGIDALRKIPHWVSLAAGLIIGELHGTQLGNQYLVEHRER